MSEQFTIDAEIREDVGKGASRRLRHAGKVPAIIYGGHKDPVSVVLDHDPVYHAAENESFYSSLVQIKVADGRQQAVVVRDLQRHPFRQLIMHIDFMRVSEGEKLRINVPLHFVNEERSPAGKAAGVVIQHQVTDIEIMALPKDLPEFLEVDLALLEPGDAVMLSSVTLPEGVELTVKLDEDEDITVANAIHIRESQGEGVLAAEADAEFAEAEEESDLEAAEGDEEAEGEEGEEGEGEADGEEDGDVESKKDGDGE